MKETDNWCSNSKISVQPELESNSCNNAKLIGNKLYAPQCFSVSEYLQCFFYVTSSVESLSSSEEGNSCSVVWLVCLCFFPHSSYLNWLAISSIEKSIANT